MDPTPYATVSFWASIAAVVFGVLAAVAITVAGYASSRVIALNNARVAQVQAESAQSIAAVEAKAADAERRAQEALDLVTRLDSQTPEPDAPVTTTGVSVPRPRPAPFTIVEERFGPDQQRALVSMLENVSSPPQVELTWIASSAVYTRATQIQEALRDAGWTVIPTGSLMTSPSNSTTTMTTPVLSDETLLLKKAFESAGLKLSIVLEPEMPIDRVRLLIGSD
jgi:hypothetical protein